MGEVNPARTNPPLYYVLEAPAYHLAPGDGLAERWYSLRLFSVLFLLVTVVATWLLIGELTGGQRLLQLAGAALAGLQPMTVFVSSSINPDAALIAAWALAFWLWARILMRGSTTVSAAALGAVTAAAILTKATSYALLPGTLLVLGWGLWRLRAAGRSIAAPAVGGASLLALPVGAWLISTRASGRSAVNAVPGQVADAAQFTDAGLVSYMWQFYLPKLPFQGGIPQIERLPVFDVWVETGWAAFGWLEVRFPEPLYVLLALVTLVLVAGGIAAVVRLRHRRTLLVLAGLFVFTGLALLAGLHWVEYRTIVNQGHSFNQGRYLLPLVPLFAAAAAGALSLLRPQRRAAAAGVLLGGLFVLQLASLSIMVARFYA